MVNSAAFLLYDIEDLTVIHGYKLDLKLETVDSLVAKKGNAAANGAPMEVIRAIDLAILEKQNLGNPVTFNRYMIWETYKPFSDKSNDQTRMILSSLPDTFRDKILYNFFAKIRKNIELKDSKGFYEGSEERRQALIDAEIDLIIAEYAIGDNGRIEIDGI
jgi:hypothetical protein